MTDSQVMHMVFEATQADGDPLGLWRTAPFETQAGTAPELASWRVELPASQSQARKALALGQRRLAQTALALPAAEDRLGEFTHHSKSGLEFALTDGAALAAEADLQRFLRRTERSARQSYGLDDMLPQIKELMQAVNRLAGNISLSLANYALVETSQGGLLIGRTRVSWLGDFSSVWGAETSPSRAALHHKAVAQALATRQHWVRIGLLVAAGGASLTSALAGNPFALLASFQFVRQVIREFQGREDSPLRKKLNTKDTKEGWNTKDAKNNRKNTNEKMKHEGK